MAFSVEAMVINFEAMVFLKHQCTVSPAQIFYCGVYSSTYDNFIKYLYMMIQILKRKQHPDKQNNVQSSELVALIRCSYTSNSYMIL